MEMHLIHTRSDLAGNINRALDKDECLHKDAYCGLAVIGILFHVGNTNNTVINVSYYSTKLTLFLNKNQPCHRLT